MQWKLDTTMLIPSILITCLKSNDSLEMLSYSINVGHLFLLKGMYVFLPDTISANSWWVLSNPLSTTGIAGITATYMEQKEETIILKFM